MVIPNAKRMLLIPSIHICLRLGRFHMFTDNLDGIVVIEELDVSGPLLVTSHEVLVTGRSLILVVTRQHALNAHTDAGDALDRTPALLT